MPEDPGPRDVFELLDRVNAAFSELGPEPYANINRLTRLCGELLGADAAVYYRQQKDSLFAVGRWGLPEDFNAVVAAASADAHEDLTPEGLYVRQGAGHGGKPPCNVSCAKMGMKACAGRPVMSGETAIGLQCALYKSAYVPHPLHGRLMRLVTGALAVEEERLRMERARQKLSEELRQSQKMEAIGLLAGGVAHDFNNALTSIRGNAELIEGNAAAPQTVQDEARDIAKAAEYAGSLTRQLLTFSRKQVVDPQLLDLNAIVTNIARMLRRTLGENISVELALAEKLECVRADTGQVEQVVMNLAVNARDAMPEGGKLVIRTASAARAPRTLRGPLRLGHRQRDEPGRPAKALRAVLHDQGPRQRHGTGPFHRLRHRAAGRRRHHGRHRDREGLDLQHPAAGPGRGRRDGEDERAWSGPAVRRRARPTGRRRGLRAHHGRARPAQRGLHGP